VSDEQRDLFDKHESERRKEEGMDAAASNSSDLVIAKQIAMELAESSPDRTTNADEVGEELWNRHRIKTLGPAAGSIFKHDRWEFTGRRIESVRKTNHGREIKVWRLR
jgi:hypothetical protein